MSTANTTTTYGVSMTSLDNWNAFCSCGWIETHWPTQALAQASLSAHLGTGHGKVRTVAP